MRLTVTATGTAQAGRYVEDIGRFAHRGTVSGVAKGTTVGIFCRRVGTTVWPRAGSATTIQVRRANGLYSTR